MKKILFSLILLSNLIAAQTTPDLGQVLSVDNNGYQLGISNINNVVGGTAVGSSLNLIGTSANGTSSVNGLNFKVGNNGSLTAISILNTGRSTLAYPTSFLDEVYFGGATALNGLLSFSGTDFIIQSGSTATTLRMGTPAFPSLLVALNTGYFGIGNVGATVKLQVTSNDNKKVIINGAASTTIIGSNYLHLGGTENTINSYRLIGFGFSNLSSASNAPAYIGYQEMAVTGVTRGDLIFGTRDVTTNAQATERFRINSTGLATFTQTAQATGTLKGIVYTGAVHTNQTLSTEIPSITLTTAGRQWATGAITTQREVLISAPTYSFVGASTISDAATLAITAAPIPGTNATITRPYSLWTQDGAVRHDVTTTTGQATAAAMSLNANSLTTGHGFYGAASSLQDGYLMALNVSGTAALDGQSALYINTSGANAAASKTTYGAWFDNTKTGSGNNVALRLGSSGGSNNYGLVVSAGRSGFGLTNPAALVEIAAGSTTIQPLRFTTGTNLTSPSAGSMEYDGVLLYFTNNGAKRYELVQSQQSRVTSQFDKTLDVTLANITNLTADVAASKVYKFSATLWVTANELGGVKFAIAGTATATSIIYNVVLVDNTGGTNAITSKQTALGGAGVGVTGPIDGFVKIEGLISVNGAGTLTVQFAQNAVNAVASSVLVGSNFKLDVIN